RELVQGALDSAGVVHGIRDEAIEKAIAAAQTGTEVNALTIAEGTPAIDQSENTLEMVVDTNQGSAVRIRNDGSADYRTRNTIVTVQKDQELCRILPSQQEPIDGVTVTGDAVPAKSVSGLQIEFGDNIERREQEDGSVLIVSATEGEFVHGQNRMEVRTTHTIKGDVDMAVGNIKFPGTVLIGGTVRAGFYVMSGGDIKIAGGVEAALLSSEGDIVVKQGVKGSGKAVLRSKNNIMSPFVELATLLSVGDVILKSAVVRSRIKCNGRITFQGDKGRLVGGTIRARNGIEATSVGSPRGVQTTISFGQDYLIADLIEKEEKEIEKVKSRISQLDMDMRKAEKESQDEQLQSLRKEKVKMLKLMEKRGLRLFTLRERFEQHFPSKVVVRGEVHTGTVFESHGRTYEVTTPRKGVSVEFDPHTGNLDISDLNGS
ncbi:MAG TPA: FapA family protein, partial [Alkalispirochaeta sp.]|nr:FapA family protein [Alkalispirochaeta sp.]